MFILTQKDYVCVSGVYQITNTVNGKFYIGSSKDIAKRFTQHRSGLRCGYHKNKHLLNAYKKYGEDAFTFTVLCECPVDELLLKEQEAIDLLKPQYNSSYIAGKVEMTKEVRAKLSLANSGKKMSEEFRKKISASLIGNKRSKGWVMPDSLRKKLSLIKKGKKTGRILSVESRAKISASLTGRKQSEETKRKKNAAVSLAKMGHAVSEETRRKISEATKGRKLSDETRKRMSDGQKERWKRSKTE